MPYYNRDPKRDHNFDNHPNDKPVWGAFHWASDDLLISTNFPRHFNENAYVNTAGKVKAPNKAPAKVEHHNCRHSSC